jgi:hypothetical protein
MLRATVAGGLLALGTGSASATENGASMYPMGNENYMIAAMPPPGVYYMMYLDDYRADSLKDSNGNDVPINFHLRADAIAPRIIWVTDQKILGGQLAFHTIIPLVNLDIDVNGHDQSKTGIGDIVLGPGLGYHLSDKLHEVFAMDINAPTGGYNQSDQTNIGHHYWNLEPLYGLTYEQPEGLNADIKVMYDFNFTNDATHYKSGEELHADYDAGWGFGNGWVAGVGGYIYQQVTDDTGPTAPSDGHKGKAFAIGPDIEYNDHHGFFITIKWEKEMSVENRPEGNEWKIKFTIPVH